MQDIERAIKKLKEYDCNMVNNVLNNGAGGERAAGSRKDRTGAFCYQNFPENPSCREMAEIEKRGSKSHGAEKVGKSPIMGQMINYSG